MYKLLLFLFIPGLCFAQKQTYTIDEFVPIDSVTHDIAYSGVVDVQGASAAELYARAKVYYLKTFNNSNAVIQIDEKDKQVSGKGVLMLLANRNKGLFGGQLVSYPVTLEIRVKDGRYRYELSQFMLQSGLRIFPLLSLWKSVYGIKLSERQVDEFRVFDEGVIVQIKKLRDFMGSKSTVKDF